MKEKWRSWDSTLRCQWVLSFSVSSHEVVGLDEGENEARALYLSWETLRVHSGPWSQLCSGFQGEEPLILLPESSHLSPEQTSWGERTRRWQNPQSSWPTSQLLQVDPGTMDPCHLLVPDSLRCDQSDRPSIHTHTHTHTHTPCAGKEVMIRNCCLSYGLEYDIYLLPDRLVHRWSSWAHPQLQKAWTTYWESLFQAPSITGK